MVVHVYLMECVCGCAMSSCLCCALCLGCGYVAIFTCTVHVPVGTNSLCFFLFGILLAGHYQGQIQGWGSGGPWIAPCVSYILSNEL